ncbi:hypothetical protein GGS23DRAFT_600496 [Durotheca rogersii]|uniref:uncharacterized protein n=1 Tax=Durotheca rogersii TaxID=419775 RepID=UPI0022202E23|nr:uncharacterized protein GGS23DRAFT_600496 [Durotheca rogersii]KAI5859371.1 hypothetical protein GGS23DRAFT_600496 [Durotheca rogersii]
MSQAASALCPPLSQRARPAQAVVGMALSDRDAENATREIDGAAPGMRLPVMQTQADANEEGVVQAGSNTWGDDDNSFSGKGESG